MGNIATKDTRLLKYLGIVALVALTTSLLSGCSFSNPETERDSAIATLEQALQNGSGSDFCVALNSIAADTCSGTILDSDGLSEADIKEFPISETSARHSIETSGFRLELESVLYEFEDGAEYLFTLIDLQVPQVSLPLGGQLAGTELLPGQSYDFMPSDEPGELEALSPKHGLKVIEVSTNPWINSYPFELRWSDNVQSLAGEMVATKCNESLMSAGYEVFERYDGIVLDFGSNFKRAATSIDTFYSDGTVHEGEVRVINSPANLSFEDCKISEVVVEPDLISVSWSAGVKFDGEVGLQTERSTIFDDYTGKYESRSFETEVAGVAKVSLAETDLEPEIYFGEVNAGMPLNSERK